jgi:hypothetical protein
LIIQLLIYDFFDRIFEHAQLSIVNAVADVGDVGSIDIGDTAATAPIGK